MGKQTCPECDGNEFYTAEVGARGDCGPNLLPGAGSFFHSPKFTICVCGRCGYVKWFVPAPFLDDIREKGKFREME